MIEIEKISINQDEQDLSITDLLVRESYEANAFGIVEKILWLEFRVENKGIRNLRYAEFILEYFDQDEKFIGCDENSCTYPLKVGASIGGRVPLEVPQNTGKAVLSVGAHKYNWPYKIADAVDRIWVFFKG